MTERVLRKQRRALSRGQVLEAAEQVLAREAFTGHHHGRSPS
ncbi:hypothetical protein [Thermomonospora sp. CIF 1]|nr:hypothetical protein [Thermomonospora sp. CIF 1]